MFLWKKINFNLKKKLDLVLNPISQENGTPSSILI